MSFLLDTNVMIGVMRNNPAIRRKLRFTPVDQVATSSIVMHELYYGAYKGTETASDLGILAALPVNVLDFTIDDSLRAGEIRAYLQARGTPIGPYDVLIAGQALARDLTLVTRSTREFSRVDGLRVENWEA